MVDEETPGTTAEGAVPGARRRRGPRSGEAAPAPTRVVVLAVTVSRHGGGGQPRVVTRPPLLALPPGGCSSPRLTVGRVSARRRGRLHLSNSTTSIPEVEDSALITPTPRLAVNIHPPISIASRSTSIPEVVYIGHSTSTSIPDAVRGTR